MAESFERLAERAKAGWADDTRRVYEAATAVFESEVEQRARLGATLADVRHERGLTQVELSELTGIQQAEISRIERGVGNPTTTTLLRLSGALGRRLELVSLD